MIVFGMFPAKKEVGGNGADFPVLGLQDDHQRAVWRKGLGQFLLGSLVPLSTMVQHIRCPLVNLSGHQLT